MLKEGCCKVLPWAFQYIFEYHWLYCLCGFVFGTDFAVFYILCDDCSHALPIYLLSCEVLHLFDAFVSFM